MDKPFLALFLFGVVTGGFLQAGEMVEITATLIPVNQAKVEGLSQLELQREATLARSRGAADLIKLSSVIESGQWATIKRGREFWHPLEYADAKIHKSARDPNGYSMALSPVPSSTSDTFVIANSPTKMGNTELGAFLRVRPTVKEDGLIYIEGRFKDTVFEGLSEEAIPITVKPKQIVKQGRPVEIIASRIDRPIFRRVDKEFGVMLPYAAGTSENARRMRLAKQQYTYFIPIELGNTVFGAPGKINLGAEDDPAGVIKSTMMKATMVRDFFIRKQEELPPREFGILILDVKKVKNTEALASAGSRIHIRSKVIETENPIQLPNPLLSGPEFRTLLSSMSGLKGTEILSPAELLIESGASGKVEIAREFIFPREFSAPALDTSNRTGGRFPVMPATPLSFQTHNVGAVLEAGGQVEAGNQIRLRLRSTILEFEGFLNYGSPVMAVKTNMIKRIKTVEAVENRIEMPVFPFRSSETELLVPNGSTVAMTMIFDYHNKNHHRDRLLKFRKAKVEEIKTPRFLTIFITAELKG